MHLSFFHLPPAQPRGDECSSLRSSTRGNEAKPDFEKQSAARPYSVTRRGTWHVFVHSRRFTRGYVGLPVPDASSHLHTFVFSVFVCHVSIIHQCQRELHGRSPSPSAGSIIRVPSTSFNVSHPSVLLGDVMNSTEAFATTARNAKALYFNLILLSSYLCQIYVSSAHSYCLVYCQRWFQFYLTAAQAV